MSPRASSPHCFSPHDFVTLFDTELRYATDILFISDDKLEDRYSIVVQFQFPFAANNFYETMNGFKLSAGGEALRVLFIAAMDFQVTTDAISAPNDSSELPTCPVCLDRLGQEISGSAATCDHYISCSCVLLWENSSCPVCKFCKKKPTESPVCSICRTTENVCLCMICGIASCGSYFQGHIKDHGQNSLHAYSLDLESKRVMASMDGNAKCLYHPEFSSKWGRAIGMRNREFVRKLQKQREVSAAQLTAATAEKEDAIDNAVLHEHEQLCRMVKELEDQKTKAKKTNKDLLEQHKALDEQLYLLRASEQYKDEAIYRLKEKLFVLDRIDTDRLFD